VTLAKLEGTFIKLLNQFEKTYLLFLDDPTLADAILDKLTAQAHRIDFKGKSLRHND